MILINLTILFLNMGIAYANENCFHELRNMTFEHNEEIVGYKFPNPDYPDTIGNDKCLDICIDKFDCIGVTYEVITNLF